jgi:hypothetical protein
MSSTITQAGPRVTDQGAVREVLHAARAEGRTALSAPEAKRVCDAYGIEVPQEGLATSAEEAVALADEIGFPVVLKIVSPDILHGGEVDIDVRPELAGVLGRPQALGGRLHLRPQKPGDELFGEHGVVLDLGRDRALEAIRVGIEQLLDRGPEHGAEIALDIAGVGKGTILGGRAGVLEQRVEHDGSLRRPPAVDRLLANTRPSRDALDGQA